MQLNETALQVLGHAAGTSPHVDIVVLRGNQVITNQGRRFVSNAPLQIHGDPNDPPEFGLLLHRRTKADTSGHVINLSLQGCALHNVTFTGKFKKHALVVGGVELLTMSNINVDAAVCGNSQIAFLADDIYDTGLPIGPTMTGCRVLSLHLNGYGDGIWYVGEVTDIELDWLTTANGGGNLVRVHRTPMRRYWAWDDPVEMAADGQPKRCTIHRLAIAEGHFVRTVRATYDPSYAAQPPRTAEPRSFEPDNLLAEPSTVAYERAALLPLAGGDSPADPPTVPAEPKDGPAGEEYDIDPCVEPPWFGDKIPAWNAPATRRISASDKPTGVPETAQAGEVIELTGEFRPPGRPYHWLNGLRGTPDRPIVFRAGELHACRLAEKIFFENCEHVLVWGLSAHKFEIGPNCRYLTFVDTLATGNPKAPTADRKFGGGYTVGGTLDRSTHHIAFVRGHAIGNGDWLTSLDQDIHGYSIGGHTNDIHILQAELTRNSGNGVQVNAGGRLQQYYTNRIFVSRCYVHSNKQAGLHAKQSADVCFIGNTIENCRPMGSHPSDWGAALGGQYGPDRLTIANNLIRKACFGCFVGSSNSGDPVNGGWGTDIAFVGNVLEDIAPDPEWLRDYNPNTAWSNAGVMMAGVPNKVIALNTMDRVCAGVNLPGVRKLDLEGNIIRLAGVPNAPAGRGEGCHVYLENPNEMSAESVRSNNVCAVLAPVVSRRERTANTIAQLPPDAWPLNAAGGPTSETKRYAPSAALWEWLKHYNFRFGRHYRSIDGELITSSAFVGARQRRQ